MFIKNILNEFWWEMLQRYNKLNKWILPTLAHRTMETTAKVVSSNCLLVSEYSESNPTQLSAMELGIQNFGYFLMSQRWWLSYLLLHLLYLRIWFGWDFISLFCFMGKGRKILSRLCHAVWNRCTHYRRRCKIRAPCCDEVFDCRHCHNEAKV